MDRSDMRHVNSGNKYAINPEFRTKKFIFAIIFITEPMVCMFAYSKTDTTIIGWIDLMKACYFEMYSM